MTNGFFDRVSYCCKNISFGKKYDIETELRDENKPEPLFHFRLKGSFSVKIYKILASLAVLSSVVLLCESISNIRKILKK